MDESLERIRNVLDDLGVLPADTGDEALADLAELYGRTALTACLQTVDALENASGRDVADTMSEWGELLRKMRGRDESALDTGEVFLRRACEVLDPTSYDTLVVTTFFVIKLSVDRSSQTSSAFDYAMAETVESIGDITTTHLPIEEGGKPMPLDDFLDGLTAEEFVAHLFDATRQSAEVTLGHPVLR